MWWFGKKRHPLWITNADGERHLTEAGKRQFDQWAAEGKIQRVDCQVHIIDPTAMEPRVETWLIGDDPGRVSRETYDQLKDEQGTLYVLVNFREGKREVHVVAKPFWDMALEKHRAIDAEKPSSTEEYFDFYHRSILSSSFEAQVVSATVIRVLLNGFKEQYPDLESFCTSEKNREFLLKMSDTVEKMASNEAMDKAPEGTGRGAALVQLYLAAAVMNEPAALVRRIGDALDELMMLAV